MSSEAPQTANHSERFSDENRIDHCGSCTAENDPQLDDRCPECGAENCLISTFTEAEAQRYRTGERYTTEEGRADIEQEFYAS